jgi:flagellar biosynthesis protein FlhB
MSQARTYPPSEQRIAAARRAGSGPRVAITGLVGSVLGLCLGLWGWGTALWAQCLALFQGPLAAFSHGEPAVASHWLQHAWLAVGSRLLLILACTWSAASLSLFLAQGPAVALPWARPERRFPTLTPPRTARALAALVVLLVALTLLPQSLRASALPRVDSLFHTWRERLVGLLVACAVVDAALARALFFRSLWMTRREHRDELREAYGSPEIRAARERVRREIARPEAP